ncbi:MAG: hypothetical protein ABGU97_00770 [Xylella fastidiosa subsp. multiplex]
MLLFKRLGPPNRPLHVLMERINAGHQHKPNDLRLSVIPALHTCGEP